MITRPQRKAIKRIYDRGPLVSDGLGGFHTPFPHEGIPPVSYRTFRRGVRPTAMGCLVVRWCGMWLGIESDGYTHS